jgi:hypothetical protein
VPPANTDDMGDSYRPLVSYDMGVAGANKVTLSKPRILKAQGFVIFFERCLCKISLNLKSLGKVEWRF